MANKNKKRGKRLIESARRRKHKRFRTMTPGERRRYEKEKQKLKNRSYEDDFKLSFKENVFVAFATIVSFTILSGITFLLYLGNQFLRGLAG